WVTQGCRRKHFPPCSFWQTARFLPSRSGPADCSPCFGGQPHVREDRGQGHVGERCSTEAGKAAPFAKVAASNTPCHCPAHSRDGGKQTSYPHGRPVCFSVVVFVESFQERS